MGVINRNILKVAGRVSKKKAGNDQNAQVKPVKTKVDSTNISKVMYDKNTKVLTLTFHRGNRKYEYYNVPSITHTNLLRAKSHGEYFHKYINHKFRYKEI